MISTPHRRQAVTLIDTARNAGARLQPACEVIGISTRTHQRWTREGAVREDQRPLVKRPVPSNALCVEETQAILDACHCPANASLPPEQIVVRLMDEEALYLGSVSTFYRVLRRHALVAHRGRARAPKRHARPTTYHATSANQVWTWDCTWLPGPDQVILIDATDALGFQARTVGGVFHGLPGDVFARIVKFILNDDQAALVVQSQKVETLLRVGKARKFLLDDQQVLTQTGRVLGYPLLQILALLETQF